MRRELLFAGQPITPRMMPLILILLLVYLPIVAQGGDNPQSPGAQLKIGSKIPELSGVDQFGKQQTFDSLKGPNGLVLLFFRSADW